MSAQSAASSVSSAAWVASSCRSPSATQSISLASGRAVSGCCSWSLPFRWSGCTSPSARWNATRPWPALPPSGCPNCPKCSRCTIRPRKARWLPWSHSGLASGRQGFLVLGWPRHRAAQSLDLGALPAAVLLRLDGVVGRRRQAADRRLQVHQRCNCSGSPRCRACQAQRCGSSTASCLPFSVAACGRRCRRGRSSFPPSAWACSAEPRHAILDLPRARAALRVRRRKLRLLDGQHLVLFPESGEGQCAGHQCGSRQSRRQRRAVRRAASHHERCLRLAGWRSAVGNAGRRDDDVVAAERRLSCSCRLSSHRRSPLGSV